MEPFDISGEKIILHMLRAEELSAWLEDEDDFSRTSGFTIDNSLVNKRVEEVFRMKLKKIEADPENVMWYTYFAILLKETRTLIGLIGYKDLPDSDGLSEIGYGVGGSYRNRGYATEAVKLLSEWSLSNTDLKVIFAQTDIDNIPSGKVLENAGFTMERQDGKMFQWKLERVVASV